MPEHQVFDENENDEEVKQSSEPEPIADIG